MTTTNDHDAAGSGNEATRFDAATVDATIAAIQARRAKVGGFEHKRFPNATFQQEGLAETDKDGKWLSWDMRIPLSREACDFIANAPADIDMLLRIVADLRAESAFFASVQQFAESVNEENERLRATIHNQNVVLEAYRIEVEQQQARTVGAVHTTPGASQDTD